MNLCAAPGHLVRAITTAQTRYPIINYNAAMYLEIDKIYTVAKSRLYLSYAEVWLDEFPDVNFCCSLFADAVDQSDELTMAHPDFMYFLSRMQRGGPETLLKRVKR